MVYLAKRLHRQIKTKNLSTQVYFPYGVSISSKKPTKSVETMTSVETSTLTSMRWGSSILLVLSLCGASNSTGIPHDLSALYNTDAKEFSWLTLEKSKMFLSNKENHANYYSFIQFCHKISYYSLQTLDSSTPMLDRNSSSGSEF